MKRTTRIYYLALFTLLTGSLTLSAKPRFVDLVEEFKTAKFIGVVVVQGYSGNCHISFCSTQFKDTIHSAYAHYFGSNGSRFPNDDSDTWTGNWPYIRDTVLIVIDSENRVSLFAKLIGNKYRFWSPFFTMSTASFWFKSPAEPLSEKNDGWDGCLLQKDLVWTYGKTK